jgi:DNA-binding protein YbaB
VVAAVNRALEAVEEKSKDFIQKETEGLLNIPGMDLNSLMKG